MIAAAVVYGYSTWANWSRNKLYAFAGKSRAFGDWRPTEPPRSNGFLKKVDAEAMK